MINRMAANIARASPLTSTSLSFASGPGTAETASGASFGGESPSPAVIRHTECRMDEHDHACCAPGRAPGGDEPHHPDSAEDASTDGMVRLGGSFLMGAEDADGFPQDREGPIREVDL